MKLQNKIADTLRWLFDVYLKSSLHVGLAVTAFSFITVLEYELHISPALLPFIFCSTVVAYNFTKYLSLTDREQLIFTPKLKAILGITILLFVCTITTIFYLDFLTLGFTIIPAFLTAAYALPLFRNQTNLRQVFGAKLFIIGVVWALVTVGLPFINHQGGLHASSETIIEGFQRLLFVMVITLPFDIRDVYTDTNQMGTIPQIYGVQATKTIGTITLIIVFLIEIFQINTFDPEVAVFLFIIGCTALLIHNSMTARSAYFAAFWVEGVPILWAALLYFFQG